MKISSLLGFLCSLVLLSSCNDKEAGGLAPKNHWLGKTISIIGDGYTQDEYYFSPLKELGAIIINKGVGNTTVTPGYRVLGRSYWDRVQTASYISGDKPDLVVLYTSVNEPFGGDNGPPIPVGGLNDPITGIPTTYYGALKQVVLKVRSESPSATMLLVTPNIVLTTSERGTYDLQKSYRDAAIAVARLYSIPTLDLFGESGFTFETNHIWLGQDQVHPSPAGAEKIGRMLKNRINQL